MASFISKILFTTTVTAPTFLSLGLIGIIKDSKNYFQLWGEMLENHIIPTSFEWWSINISLVFMLICLIGIKVFLYKKSTKLGEGKTIKVQSYSNLSQNSAEQVVSSIIPWLTIFADRLDFMVLFVCVILQCCFIAVASYNNNNYNLLCSIWGYRYYEVCTEENTYILISGKCIRNKNEIKMFARDSMQINSLVKIQGTAIKGGQLGNISFLSTTVEPSEMNKDRYSHLWITDDGISWREIFKEKKDIWPFIFQFGSIEFPRYKCSRVLQRIFFNGRALKNIDGCSLSISIE